MIKKKPPGQIFPEGFYQMFLTPIKFWTIAGKSGMSKLAWLLIIGIIGLNVYFIIEIDSKRVEIMNKLQSYNYMADQILEYNIDDKIQTIVHDVTDGLTDYFVIQNNDFVKNVQTTLTENTKRQKKLLSLLHDKIDYYGVKVDYFENNLDSTLNDNTEKIIETYKNDLSVLKNDITNINSEINNIDSLFLKLQNSWFTKQILK